MKLSQIIEIGRQIIYLAWYYKNYDESTKEKIERKLKKFKQGLNWNTDKYSKKLLLFIDDLLWDLSKNKPLQIDKVFEDDFVGNYYNTKKQVEIYNNLINEEDYKKIIEKLCHSKDVILGLDPGISSKSIELQIEKLYNNFKQNYKKLDTNAISSSLLIFTTFEYKSPKKYLVRLYKLKNNFSFKSIRKIEKMLRVYDFFLQEIFNLWIKNLENNSINYKYIKASRNKTNENISINFELIDTSKIWFRSWKVRFEYKELLKKLR